MVCDFPGFGASCEFGLPKKKGKKGAKDSPVDSADDEEGGVGGSKKGKRPSPSIRKWVLIGPGESWMRGWHCAALPTAPVKAEADEEDGLDLADIWGGSSTEELAGPFAVIDHSFVEDLRDNVTTIREGTRGIVPLGTKPEPWSAHKQGSQTSLPS